VAAGIVLLVLAVGLFLFILVEGDSCGCLVCLVIPLAMAVAGVYLIVTDPFAKAPAGTVLGRYRGLSLADGQGVVIRTSGRPYRVAGTTGATVGLERVSGRETLRASLLTRPRGAATYQGCVKALRDAGSFGGAALAGLRPGQAWCTRDYGEYADDRSVRMIRITGVRARPARVVFDVTVWKAG
jgi:hypothetical protein